MRRGRKHVCRRLHRPDGLQLDPAAVVDDGSCEELDECGVCGGLASSHLPAIVMAT